MKETEKIKIGNNLKIELKIIVHKKHVHVRTGLNLIHVLITFFFLFVIFHGF